MTTESEQAKTNTRVVQEIYALFARRDMGAMLQLLSPNVVWEEPDNPFNPAAGTRQGHAGFLEWARTGSESEEILSLELRQFVAQGNTVAAIGHMSCRAKATGKKYESDFVHVVTIKDGKVQHFQEFFDTFAAGEAFRQA